MFESIVYWIGLVPTAIIVIFLTYQGTKSLFRLIGLE